MAAVLYVLSFCAMVLVASGVSVRDALNGGGRCAVMIGSGLLATFGGWVIQVSGVTLTVVWVAILPRNGCRVLGTLSLKMQLFMSKAFLRQGPHPRLSLGSRGQSAL